MSHRPAAIALALAAVIALGGVFAGRALASGILGTGIGPTIGPNVPGLVCKVAGTVGEGWMGSACNAAEKAVGLAGKAKGAGKKVAGVLGSGVAQRLAGIAAITAAALGGARFVLSHMSNIISQTSEPALTAAWFGSRYLRLEALAVLLTLPFLAAAAIQALLRQDLAVLARAAFAYLPLAALATAIAVPVTMMLLAVSDELSTLLARAAGQDAQHFFQSPGTIVTAALATAIDPFIAGLAACLIVAGGLAVWLELELRAVAVYVVVMMLPLVFAVMVWPSRRVWATRTVEMLVALIFSKVAIVAVLSIGAAAIGHGGGNIVVKVLAGIALLALGAFAPWVLLRLIPLAEVASSAVGHVRGQIHAQAGTSTPEQLLAGRATEHAGGWSDALLARMRATAQEAHPSPARPDPSVPPPEPAASDAHAGTVDDAASPDLAPASPAPAPKPAAPERAPAPARTAAPPTGNGNPIDGSRDGWDDYALTIARAGAPPRASGSPSAGANGNGASRGWQQYADIVGGTAGLSPAAPEPPTDLKPPEPPVSDPQADADGEL